MDWTIRNDLPIYSQLVEQIKLGIVSGQFPPGERLASVRDMAAEAGVNPNTLQRALQELEREGLVFSQRTSGRFVTEDTEAIRQVKEALAWERVGRFLSGMEQLGYDRETIVRLIQNSVEEEKDEFES